MGRFTSWDGLQIAFDHHGEDNPIGPLPRVVLHHGFAADGFINWVATGVVEALVSAGRRVTTIDARGHGQSDKPHDPARYGEQNMARDLSTLLDVLGEPTFDLVGYSMGAIVALIAAARETRIRKLVVGGVGAGVIECGGVDSRVLPPGQLIEALTVEDPSVIQDPGARGLRALADYGKADRLALAAQCRMVHASPIALGAIGVPTLLLAGDDDPLASRPETLADAIPHAHPVLVRGGHQEAVADPCFAQELVRFIAT